MKKLILSPGSTGYAIGVPLRTKRNALIDFEGLMDSLCQAYGSVYCSEVSSVEREIRKLS